MTEKRLKKFVHLGLKTYRVKKELWGGEFWEDGNFVRTVEDKVTSGTMKKYIEYHRHEEKTAKQLEFDF